MFKAYKYRLLPTKEQAIWLDGQFNACKFVYNLALETKISAWTSARINLSAYDLINQLPDLKEGAPWLKKFSNRPLQSAILFMEKAYKNFFNGGGFPRFKNSRSKMSATFVADTLLTDNRIKLPKIGEIEFIRHREIGMGKMKTVVISKENTGKYYVSILIKSDAELPNKFPISEPSTLGIDVGIKSFATFSNGDSIDNQKHFQSLLRRLIIEQRKLSRKFKKGIKQQSKGFQKQKGIVAAIYEKISNRRMDFLHKLSHQLISNYDTIVIEDLNIKGLMQNPKLAQYIADVSWYEFIQMLAYKADWKGKNLIKIGRFEPSSKTCSNCQLINKELALSDRTWTCGNCGTTHDRDFNAAINIKNSGLRQVLQPLT